MLLFIPVVWSKNCTSANFAIAFGSTPERSTFEEDFNSGTSWVLPSESTKATVPSSSILCLSLLWKASIFVAFSLSGKLLTLKAPRLYIPCFPR